MRQLRVGKGKLAAGLAATAMLVLVPLTVVEVTTAGASNLRRDQVQQGGPVTIQSWLYLVPSENVLSGTVWDCFKITGAINDEGGGPTWTDDTSYHAPNTLTTGGLAAAGAALI